MKQSLVTMPIILLIGSNIHKIGAERNELQGYTKRLLVTCQTNSSLNLAAEAARTISRIH